jgi:hypothetical protein
VNSSGSGYDTLFILRIPSKVGVSFAAKLLWPSSEVFWFLKLREFWSILLVVYKLGFFRTPQQMLRTHRSLEAYCATLWWRWSVFFVFPSNGAPVEWNWQGKTEVLGGKPVRVPLCPPQIPHGLTRDTCLTVQCSRNSNTPVCICSMVRDESCSVISSVICNFTKRWTKVCPLCRQLLN